MSLKSRLTSLILASLLSISLVACGVSESLLPDDGDIVAIYRTAVLTINQVREISTSPRMTYEQYKTLTDLNADYAKAIEYSHGEFVLNYAKSEEITQNMLDDVEEKVDRETELIRTNERYQALVGRGDELSESELAELNAFNAQIMGYGVLVNDLHNMVSPYEIFKAAVSYVPQKGYTEKYGLALTALQIVEDV
ncbi:MAG: hypothetical protein Q4D04_12650, partial [Clostridia bacterium]|nr:hypothetical protein [Clostridia bacterium]